MVVAELDVVRIPVNEAKTNSPLVVYRNRILALSISCKRVKPITRGNPEILKARREIHIFQLSSRSLCDVSWNTPPFSRRVQLLSAVISERLYHQAIVTRHVTRGKRLAVPHNAAVERRRAALSSAPHVHNEMAHLRRARDDV